MYVCMYVFCHFLSFACLFGHLRLSFFCHFLSFFCHGFVFVFSWFVIFLSFFRTLVIFVLHCSLACAIMWQRLSKYVWLCFSDLLSRLSCGLGAFVATMSCIYLKVESIYSCICMRILYLNLSSAWCGLFVGLGTCGFSCPVHVSCSAGFFEEKNHVWIVLSRTYIMYEPTITREPVYPTASPIIQLHTTPARIPTVRSIVAENLVFHRLPHDFQASVLASAFASEKARVKEVPLLKVKKCMVHGSSLWYSCSTRDFKIPLIQV